jgi:hypothetical protein
MFQNMNATTSKVSPKKNKEFRYKIKTDGERREVEWLVSQGDFKSIKEYEDFWTKVANGQKKPTN